LCHQPADGSSPTVVSAFVADGEMTAPLPASACSSANGSDRAAGKGGVSEVVVGSTPGTFEIGFRSTLEIIQFVGQILAFQEMQSAKTGIERCVTLEFERLDGPTCNGGTLFHLEHSVKASSASIQYDDRVWSLPEARPCTNANRCDHTLEAMAMISLLLNQNKSGKDIPTTPAVQSLP